MLSINSISIPNDDIRLNYSERLRSSQQSKLMSSNDMSFKGKKQFIKKTSEKIVKVADKENWKQKFLGSGFFGKFLDLMGGGQEVFVQAAISAIVCCLMRPATIMALPAKDKDNNKYASAHSISSGIMGIVSSIIISAPFAKGVKYAQRNLMHYIKPEILKDMFPHLDVKSITDAAGKKKPIGEWLDVFGNKFSEDTKNVMMVARPQAIETFSESTLKELGADVDLKAMQGKRASEWVTRKGEKLNFRPQDMFIEIQEEGVGDIDKKTGKAISKNYFSLGLTDKKFLGEVFENLDVNTIEKEGKRINPLEWKNKDGSQFMPDLLDHVYLSSYRETKRSIPLYSGITRTETSGDKLTKYCAYQRNIKGYEEAKVPEKLGTEISQEMLNKDGINTIQNKLLIWIPDILTRAAVAAATIKLIPIVLKQVFHLEKKKKPDGEQQQIQNNINVGQTDSSRKVAA